MADVMLNCSREDTLSSLNIESQACGTPVITYAATGSGETVDNQSSFTVPVGNYGLMFTKMMDIYNRGKLSFSNSCRKYIEDNFEKAANYYKYVKLYRELVNEQ